MNHKNHPLIKCEKPFQGWLQDARRGFKFAARVTAALAVSFGLAAHAQVNTGNLSGLVTDPAGAAVRGATVKVLNDATGYSRSVQTGDDGNYLFPDLPIGNYVLTLNAGGFETESELETISVGSRTRSDFHLRVGSADQTVEVAADASGLSRDDASISTLVTNDTIKETPLFLRNWDDLLRTVPGVQINRYTEQSGATSAGRTGDFNVNGVHTLAEQFHPRRHRQQHLLRERAGAEHRVGAPFRRCHLRVQRHHQSVLG